MTKKFDEGNLLVEDELVVDPDLEALEAEDESTEDTTFEVPEKFTGKTIEEVITSYTNLESEYGRKNNEVGELRKLTDDILRQKVQPLEADQSSNEVGFDDLIEDPKAAIDKALAQNPRLAALEADIAATAQGTAHKAILERHEDADAVVQSPEFQKWVGENPHRQKMFADASNNLDAGTASEMLDLYKSNVQMKTDAAIAARDGKASDGMKLAANEKGGKTPAKSRKVYKRSELIKLKISNPRQYEKMAPEINKAYAEGRVR